MTPTERSTLLSAWIKPSSDNEQTQQDRAQRMVTEAIKQHPPFNGINPRVYAKGSYANNTNVRRGSDVDIVVENHDCLYSDYAPDAVLPPPGPMKTYAGPWTPSAWRTEVVRALAACFGTAIDTSGKIAIAIPEVSGSRPSIDVVPSFKYQYFRDTFRTPSRTEEGSCVFNKDLVKIVNWPSQQLANGRTKNDATGKRYKNLTRALKNAEDTLARAGQMKALPSYFMECLVYNVPNDTLKTGTLDYACQEMLRWQFHNLGSKFDHKNWIEPNRMKYLFSGSQKWTKEEGRALILETWKYLGFK